MDNTTRELLESVADNDLIKAKKCVRVLLENNNKNAITGLKTMF